MIMPDELQQLWQQDDSPKENDMIWMELIQEKRRGFEALMRVERQMEYLITLVFVPLLGVMAWKSKFPVTQVGYGVLAATLLGLATSLWHTGRNRPQPADRTLRAHLDALIHTYSRYLRFSRIAKVWNAAGLVLGYLAVVFGVPASGLNFIGRAAACVVLAGLCGLLWRAYARSEACLLSKRGEAARLLKSLPDEGAGTRSE